MCQYECPLRDPFDDLRATSIPTNETQRPLRSIGSGTRPLGRILRFYLPGSPTVEERAPSQLGARRRDFQLCLPRQPAPVKCNGRYILRERAGGIGGSVPGWAATGGSRTSSDRTPASLEVAAVVDRSVGAPTSSRKAIISRSPARPTTARGGSCVQVERVSGDAPARMKSSTTSRGPEFLTTPRCSTARWRGWENS